MKNKWKEKISRSPFQRKEKSPFITVKTSLKSILKDPDHNYPILNQLVMECHEIVIRTYQLIRLYVLYKYYHGQSIPHLDKDTILYFIRAGGIRDHRGRKSVDQSFETELDQFYEKEFQPCFKKGKYNLHNKSYLTPYLAQQIQTGFNNNIKVHFLTRIRRFMNLTKPFAIETEEEKNVFSKVKNLILLDKHGMIPEPYQPWSQNIKKNYLPPTYEKCYGYDVKVNPDKYLFFTIKMNQVIEQNNEEIRQSQLTEEEKRIQLKKLFQPIPLRNTIIPCYMTLDANSVLSMFGGNGDSSMNQHTKLNKEYIWSKIFCTEKSVMKRKGYEYKTIQTDGIGVSICFQKVGRRYHTIDNPDQEGDQIPYITDLSETDLETCRQRKMVGVDPGKQSLVHMMDQDRNQLRYTASQRRVESRSKRCQNITLHEKMIHHIQEEEAKLTSYQCQTVDYQKFKSYITEKTKLNDTVRDFYERELFRKMKWRKWIARRRSEDLFLNRIEQTYGKPEEILLCYGNWSQTKQMKHLKPTMGVGLRKKINQKFDMVLIDEFRSSKLCNQCHQELTHYQTKDSTQPNQVQSIYRLLVCPHCRSDSLTSKNSYFFNRDANACGNLLHIGQTWLDTGIRPVEYCRKLDPDLTPQNLSLEEKQDP